MTGSARRRLLALTAMAAAMGTGAGLAQFAGLWRNERATGPPPPIPASTAVVQRTTVSARETSIGTLGYAGSYTVVSDPGGGVLTRLPAPGTVITRGQPVYEADGGPVRLLYGLRPAWRDFQIGMPAGPDVKELERNLVALGLDPGHDLTAGNQFTWATAAAIDRWQLRSGLPRTGTLLLGQVAFLPGPIRVTADVAAPGAPLTPGATILTATSTQPVVSVALDVASQGLIHRGNKVLVTLPGGAATTTGTVSWVSPVAVQPPQSASAQATNGPVIPVTIRLDHPKAAAGFDQAPVQVIITQQEHRGVLAVPITALLAQPQGYAVDAVQNHTDHLIPVTTGLFDDAAGIVEVTGPGLHAGLRVEVAGG